MSSPSALSPTFQPFRPSGTDWVAYHDTHPTTGVPGLAMTWRERDGGLRYVVALDRQRDGHVAASGRLHERDDVTEVVGRVLRERPGGTSEATLLATLLPRPGHPLPFHGDSGFPPIGEHAELARRAVAEARLTPGMRAAFAALLDHGYPVDFPLADLRRRTFRPYWSALALAVTRPVLARMVRAADPGPLADDEPLAAIARRWPGLSEAHLRRMEGPDGPPNAGKAGRIASLNSLDLLSGCPVDWWPRAGTWPSFVACAQTLQSIRSAWPDAVPLNALASASKGDWEGFAGRLYRAAGIETPASWHDELLARGNDCRDPVRALAHGVILPLLAVRGGCDEAVERLDAVDAALAAAGRLLYGGKSAAAILETSRDWHARRAAMEAEIRSDGGNAAWPRLFDGEFRDGNVGVVAIGDHAGLRDEGATGPDRNGVPGLDHCVATRLSECLSGAAHVLSVRLHGPDGAWRRLSTCQVRADRTEDGNVSVTVTEHRGPGNEEPDRRAIETLDRLAEALRTGKVAAPDEALSRRRGNGQGLSGMCGYDWQDPEAVANAVRAWLPLLPRWARELDPDELHDALVERDMLPEPDPAHAPVPGAR